MIVAPDATDVTAYFMLTSSTDGSESTGLTITDLDLTYVRDRAAAVKTDATALAAADSDHADNKAFEVDSTNAPGLYRADFPDAAFADGVNNVQLIVKHADTRLSVIEVELSNVVGTTTVNHETTVLTVS